MWAFSRRRSCARGGFDPIEISERGRGCYLHWGGSAVQSAMCLLRLQAFLDFAIHAPRARQWEERLGLEFPAFLDRMREFNPDFPVFEQDGRTG